MVFFKDHAIAGLSHDTGFNQTLPESFVRCPHDGWHAFESAAGSLEHDEPFLSIESPAIRTGAFAEENLVTLCRVGICTSD